MRVHRVRMLLLINMLLLLHLHVLKVVRTAQNVSAIWRVRLSSAPTIGHHNAELVAGVQLRVAHEALEASDVVEMMSLVGRSHHQLAEANGLHAAVALARKTPIK